MNTYVVSWTVIVQNADGPMDAALQASEMFGEPGSSIVKVICPDGKTEEVDLA